MYVSSCEFICGACMGNSLAQRRAANACGRASAPLRQRVYSTSHRNTFFSIFTFLLFFFPTSPVMSFAVWRGPHVSMTARHATAEGTECSWWLSPTSDKSKRNRGKEYARTGRPSTCKYFSASKKKKGMQLMQRTSKLIVVCGDNLPSRNRNFQPSLVDLSTISCVCCLLSTCRS